MSVSVSRAALVLILLLAGPARDVRAQFSNPCSVGCSLLLLADSYVLATGASTTVGRLKGGFSNPRQGIIAWGSGFVVAAGAGMALSGDGERQQRAIRAAAIGAVGGALAGLAVESIFGESTKATRLAATLIGAGLGVAVGGTVGAITYEQADPAFEGSAAWLTPAFSIQIGF